MHGHAFNIQQPIQSSLGWSRHDGVVALLRSGNDNSTEEPALPRQAHPARIVRSVLLRSRSIPPWMFDSERMCEHGLDLEDVWIQVRIVALRRALSLLSISEQYTEEAKKSDTEAQDLSRSLHE